MTNRGSHRRKPYGHYTWGYVVLGIIIALIGGIIWAIKELLGLAQI